MKIKIPRWIILFILFTIWVVIVTKIPKTSLLYPLLFAPVIEELVFRFATLEIIMRDNVLRKQKWLYLIIISFVFGAIHFNQNMFLVQGLMGFILGYLYIHHRGKHNSSFIAYLIVVLFHILWNTLCVFGLKYLI